MKQKLSVSLDEKLVEDLDRILSGGKYRNKSHVVEFAVKKLLGHNQSSTGSAIPPASPKTHPEQKNG